MCCCEVHSVVVIAFAFQLSHPGSKRTWATKAWNGNIRSIDAVRRSGKGMHGATFLLVNLALQLGLGQRCQPEG